MSDEKAKGPPSTAVVPANPASHVSIGRGGIMLQSLEDLLRFGQTAVNAGAAPKGMTAGQAALVIQAGLERGLGPLAGLNAGVVINGVISWRGWAAIGFIQNSPVCVPGTFQSWVEGSIEEGTAVGYCRAQRRGYAQPFIRSFSIADAKKGGLWGKDGPWRTRPANMLEWRAIGDIGRFHFGDVLGGLPIAEDVEAGGVGPVGPQEMPERLLPSPPPAVRDPILVELGIAPPLPAPPVTIVADPKMDPTKVRLVNPDGSVGAEIVNVAPPDKIEGPALAGEAPRGSPPASQSAPGKPAASSAPVTPVNASAAGPEVEGGKGKCQRCRGPLNAMGGCDVCGWPGPDLR